MLGPCWYLSGACGHDFETTGHHRETLGQQFVVWGTHVWNFIRFWLLSGPCGAGREEGGPPYGSALPAYWLAGLAALAGLAGLAGR